jgi:hypothetical protein
MPSRTQADLDVIPLTRFSAAAAPLQLCADQGLGFRQAVRPDLDVEPERTRSPDEEQHRSRGPPPNSERANHRAASVQVARTPAPAAPARPPLALPPPPLLLLLLVVVVVVVLVLVLVVLLVVLLLLLLLLLRSPRGCCCCPALQQRMHTMRASRIVTRRPWILILSSAAARGQLLFLSGYPYRY